MILWLCICLFCCRQKCLSWKWAFMNSELRGKVGILAHREQLHIIFLFLSHNVIITLLCNFADATLLRCSVQPSLPRVHCGFSEEHGNANADSLYIRRHPMVSILLIVQKLHLLGLHSQQMARTQLFPGQETSLLFMISLGRILKTIDLMCTSVLPARVSAHQRTASEPVGLY